MNQQLQVGATQASQDSELRATQLALLELLKSVDAICQKHQLDYWLDSGTLLGAIRHKGFIPWDDDIDIAMPRASYERFLKLAPAELPADLYVDCFDYNPGYVYYATPCKVVHRRSAVDMLDVRGRVLVRTGLFLDIFPSDKFHTSGFGRVIDGTLKLLYRKLCGLHDARMRPVRSLRALLNNILVVLRPALGANFFVSRYRAFLRRFAVLRSRHRQGKYALGPSFDCYWSRRFKVADIYPLAHHQFEDAVFPVPRNADAILTECYGNWRLPPPEDARNRRHYRLVSLDGTTTAGAGARSSVSDVHPRKK